MFCPNCGNELPTGAKFCPNCGAPVPEIPVNEAPAVPEAPVPEIPMAPVNEVPEAPEIPAAPAGVSPAAVTISQDNMVMVLRVVCGVLGAIFAFFALKNAFGLAGYVFNWLGSLPGVLRGYFHFGIIAYLFSFVLNLLTELLGLAAPALAAAVLLLAAVKWEKKHADLVFCGVALAAVLRLVLLILTIPFSMLLNFFVHYGGLGFTISFFTTSLLHVLGYAAAAAILFLLMHLLGCAPVMGKSIEQVRENIRGSVSDVSGAVKKAAGEVSQKAAAMENPAPAAPAAAPAAPNAYSRRMATNRGLLKYILLNFITCGIYSYIFIYSLANDVNEVCDGDGEKTGGLLAFLLLGFVTCGVYQLIWWYKLCNRVAANGPRYGVTIQENGTTYLLWTLVGAFLCGIGPFIAMYQILRNMNTLCAAYNRYNGFTA